MIIEARPGAGSNIAAEAVVRAPADGYTLLMASNANAINATLYQKLNFDFLRDITLVASVARVPLVMWWSIRYSRQGRCPISSPMQRPIPAR